jgi:hypothetical protein
VLCWDHGKFVAKGLLGEFDVQNFQQLVIDAMDLIGHQFQLL